MPEKPEESIVVVAETAGVMQAELLRGLLEAQGIPVMLSGESAAITIGLSNSTMGIVQILVRAEHAAEARKILEAYEAGELGAMDLEDAGDL